MFGRPMGRNSPAPTQAMPMHPTRRAGTFGGFMSPSMGLFQAYMSQLFNQRYAPPVMPNTPGSVQPIGRPGSGQVGFGTPTMPPIQPRQQPQPTNPYVSPPGQNDFWNFHGGAAGM